MEPKELKENDRILFNNRSVPLTVKKRISDGVIVEGPNGGEYELYTNEGAKLVSKKNSRKYSSYAENIRKVGKWLREEKNIWKHSKTDAKIQIRKNSAGFFKINFEGFDSNEIDQPKYGYSEREFAEEDVKKLIKKNPEGK